MLKMRTILCPTDLSDSSFAAFRLACALARDYGAKIIVLYVYPTPADGADMVDRARDTHFEEDLVDTIRAKTPEHLGVVVDFRVAEGSPAEVILSVARECDLVVIGTHGRRGLRRVLMGSVAEQALREAPCPVMTVRPEMHIPAESLPATTTAATENVELGVGD